MKVFAALSTTFGESGRSKSSREPATLSDHQTSPDPSSPGFRSIHFPR